MKDFGKQVKTLRQAKKMTKEDFCEDEIELSVRQLTRIESGVSIPTLAKVEFIAKRLGVSIGELTDEDQLELPKRYKELKFLLLRTQTYLEKKRIAKRTAYIEEIFNDFYDNLPEEEQLIIEILQARLDIIKATNDFSAKKILDDYLEQVKQKSIYTINDLILLDLYFFYMSYKEFQEPYYQKSTFEYIIKNLSEMVNSFPIDELFFLNKVISGAASNAMQLKDKDNFFLLISRMNDVINITQDFQRIPILSLLKWKYYIMEQDLPSATKCYQEAYSFASLTQDLHLAQRLEKEWQKDCSN